MEFINNKQREPGSFNGASDDTHVISIATRETYETHTHTFRLCVFSTIIRNVVDVTCATRHVLRELTPFYNHFNYPRYSATNSLTFTISHAFIGCTYCHPLRTAIIVPTSLRIISSYAYWTEPTPNHTEKGEISTTTLPSPTCGHHLLRVVNSNDISRRPIISIIIHTLVSMHKLV